MLDYAIIIFYLCVVLLVGLLSGKGMKSLKDFSVSHRSYTSLVIFATLSASFIGGGFSIGNAEKVFRLGISGIVGAWVFIGGEEDTTVGGGGIGSLRCFMVVPPICSRSFSILTVEASTGTPSSNFSNSLMN